MKQLTRIFAMLLALMLLAGCSLVEIDQSKVIVARVEDKTISKAEFDESFRSYLALYGYTPESSDIQDSIPELKTNYLEAMIEELVVSLKVEEMGLQATQEEIDAAYQNAQDWYDEQFDALVEEYSKDETIADPEEHAREIIQQHLTVYGYEDLDGFAEDSLKTTVNNKLFDETVKDVTVTEQEVKDEYDAQVAQDEESYAEDLLTFCQDLSGGMTIYWAPEGVFYVKHILLAMPEDVQDEISTMRAEGNDDMADALRKEELQKLQGKVDEVLKKIAEGEDFDGLIEEYGEDPGMAGSENGYPTAKGLEGLYVDEFARACDTLVNEGDTTDPVATDYGYHIIRRYGDVPAGATPYEDVSELLNARVLSSKQNAAYDEALQGWMEEYNIQRSEHLL